MKTVKMVQDMVRKAMGKGEAEIRRNGQPLYKCSYQNGILRMTHYGTRILVVESDYVAYIGGYSASDRDAINNALYVLGVSGKAFIKNGTLDYVA